MKQFYCFVTFLLISLFLVKIVWTEEYPAWRTFQSKNVRINYEAHYIPKEGIQLRSSVTELIRENLSMSIVSETSSAKLIELLFRNESRNFVVDARQPELTCRNDTSNRWQEFMLNGLFEYMTFDVSYNFREKYNYSAGKECVFWQHPHYAVYAYIDLQDARQPFCSLISFDGEDVWKYKSVTFETEVIDEKVFRPLPECD